MAMFDRPARQRAKLSGPSKLLMLLLMAAVVIIMMRAVTIDLQYPATHCPVSTFHHGRTGSGGNMLAGILIGTLSFPLLPCLIGMRFNIWTLEGGYIPQLRHQRLNTILIILSALGTGIAAAFIYNDANHYYCLGPSGVVTRAGYLANPRHLAWDDIRVVYGWCKTVRPRNQTPYKGAALTLEFDDGEKIQYGMTYGGEILTRDNALLKNLLHDRNYQYYVNSSVTPASCPPGLFPVLWAWHAD